MIRICFIMAALTIVLVLPVASLAEQFEYKEYTIERGDTLWGISGKELKDSFQWPLLWRENPKLKSPDLIFPGDTLRIPSSLVPQKEAMPGAPAPVPSVPEAAKPEAPAPVKIAPVKKEYLFSRDEMLSAGFMTKTVASVGEIKSPLSYREIISQEDDVYLTLGRSASVGEKFLVAGSEEVDHPVTGKFEGYLVQPFGVVQVTEVGEGLVRARVVKAFHRIGRGNILLEYEEQEPVYMIEEAPRPKADGLVLAVKHQRLLGAQLDLIFLDKGSSAGLKTGDVLMTVKGPDKNGVLQIMKPTAEYSTALIRKSNAQINPGDTYIQMKD